MDATKRPLLIPPEFSSYAEKHKIFQTFEHLIKQLVINQPKDPLEFLSKLLGEDDTVPQIIIQGPPASGKRSIAKITSKALGCIHINLVHLLLDLDSPAAKQAEACVQSKKEIPTDVWISMIHERIKQPDCIKKGWVIEGFPSTRPQALALQVAGIIPKHFVVLDAPDTVLMERAIGKRIDPHTGDVYHATFEPATDVDVAMRLGPDPNSSESKMAERLKEYHRNTEHVLSCYKRVLKKINADQPKADVFAQVSSYLTTNQRSLTPHTPRIVLLGATGSGKSVQASLVARKYNIVDVDCDVLIKQSLADDSKVGEAIKTFVEKNMDIPDDLVLQLLRNRLSQLDCVTRGWVLHAFPKTRQQAERMTGDGFEPNRVLLLDVPKETILERLTLRSTDPQTGERYHLLYNPPRSSEIKRRLQTHPEDEEERVTERFLAYQEHIEDIAEYYEQYAQHINADQDPHTVFEYIESMVVGPLPKKD